MADFSGIRSQNGKVTKSRVAVIELKKRIDGGRGLTENGEGQLKPYLEKLHLLQAEHERLRKKIAEGSVVAPTNGVVVERHRFTGEFAPQSEPILTLVEEGSHEVILYLRQSSSKKLALGNTIDIIVEPLNEPVKCQVARIGQEFVPAPAQIKRDYREDEWLLPVYLLPTVRNPILSIGTKVKMPLRQEPLV